MKNHAARLAGCLVAVGGLFLGLTCSERAFGAGAAASRRVLVVTVTKGFRHSSIPTAEKVLGDLAEKSGAFTVDYVRTDEDMAKKMTADALKNYAAAVFANTTGDLPLPDKGAFLDWIRSGKGFVGIHAANDTFRGHKPLDSYIVMLGGEFKSHGPEVDVEVFNQDPHHPACKHYPPTFHIFDEIYLMNGFHRSRVRGLLTLDQHPNTGAPGDYPVAWCRLHGRGRVFYTSLGHREEVWEDADYQQHILGGIQWALGLVRTAVDPQDTKAGLSVSEAGQGFKLLFNGVNLTGWKLRNPAGRQSWSAQNGMLVNEMSETEPGNDLVSVDTFRDFTLRYEYMIPKDGKSGVFLRGRHEIQIADDFDKGQPDIGGNGALYNIAPPTRFASRRPGQWQQVEVTLQGNRVTVFLNNVKVLQNVVVDRPTGNELDANLHDPGPILLQGTQGPVAFRNLRIKPLRNLTQFQNLRGLGGDVLWPRSAIRAGLAG
jgi:uncharacterized protein